jgi:hypothetical protein
VAGTLGEGLVGIARAARRRATIVVSGAQWGVSTDYIGATEGNVRFDTSDMTDLGINTYRIYGGMSRWEWQNPYATYGAPAIDQIKADPNVVNRAWWDNAMTIPPNGSDYWWRGPSGLWQGNARTMFAGLQSAGIRPVLTLRNRDNNGNPAWAPNPPVTADDWNVWWGHVFSTVYWLSVRNSYNVDDFEIHNEPNNAKQGWGGTESQYFTFCQYTHDAITYVYNTYLPGRSYSMYAPVTSGSSGWANDALQQVPQYFDSVDIHDYSGGGDVLRSCRPVGVPRQRHHVAVRLFSHRCRCRQSRPEWRSRYLHDPRQRCGAREILSCAARWAGDRAGK